MPNREDVSTGVTFYEVVHRLKEFSLPFHQDGLNYVEGAQCDLLREKSVAQVNVRSRSNKKMNIFGDDRDIIVPKLRRLLDKPDHAVRFLEKNSPGPGHCHHYYELRLQLRHRLDTPECLEIVPPETRHLTLSFAVFKATLIFRAENDALRFVTWSNSATVNANFINDTGGEIFFRQLALMDSAHEKKLYPESRIELSRLVLSMLIELISTAKLNEKLNFREESSTVASAGNYIHYNYFRPELSVADIAGILGVNPRYLPGLFRRHFGMTVSEYITEARLRRACELLDYGDLSISDVAKQCGWKRLNYFSTVFKKRLGITPAQYAKSRHNGKIRDAATFTGWMLQNDSRENLGLKKDADDSH